MAVHTSEHCLSGQHDRAEVGVNRRGPRALTQTPSPQGSRDPGVMLPRKLKQVVGAECWTALEALLAQGTEVRPRPLGAFGGLAWCGRGA